MRTSATVVETPVQNDVPNDVASKGRWSPKGLLRHAERSHSRMPGIRKIPLRAIAVILFVALINVVVWIAAAIVLVSGYI